MKHLDSFSLTFFLLISATIIFANPVTDIRLTTNWQFLKSDLGGIWEAVRPAKAGQPETVPLWENVQLPHCVNATDAVDPDLNYYQGPTWYKTQLNIKNPYANGLTLLHFDGAGQKTDVYIYTTKVGSHIGGYDEWTVDITNAVAAFLKDKKTADAFKGQIPLSIRNDNSRDLEMIPSDLSDFNLYGGIYRPLHLQYRPALSVKNWNVATELDLKKKVGKFQIALELSNFSKTEKLNIDIEIKNPQGKIIFSNSQEINVFKGTKSVVEFEAKKIALWSPMEPNLYNCQLKISSQDGEQQLTKKVGFRNFEFVEKGPFKLNGERLLLRGTHRHEDYAGVGAALTDAMMRSEIQLMKDMGVNFIRLGHYQQSSVFLNLCDSIGLLVWEEIPWCRGGLGGDKYKSQARQMMSNMINQHRDHPSIILWGLGNENDWPNDFSEFDEKKIQDFMSELNDLAHQLDPTRKTSIRRCDFCKDIPDVYSPSIWAGWYRGVYTEYKATTETEIARVKHFFHAEWGGDSHAGRHSEVPDKGLQNIKTGVGADERMGDASLYGGAARVSKDGDWSESYICNLFDWHLKEQETMPNLTGSAAWIFKDFSTPVRPENPVPYMNQKGVVERDGTKKEAYFVFQSYWTEKPMAHIYGHSWPTRWGELNEEKMVKVYSNCSEAELFVNGKSLGVKKRNSQDFPAAGLRWNVVYNQGENTIKVIAKKGKVTVTDEITQYYQTEKWAKPALLTLKKIAQQNDTATIEVRLLDDAQILCLDARNRVHFGLIGDGKLIDNLGTASGSRVVELQNGRAIIRVKLNNGKNIASVKSDGMPTVFCEL